MGRKIHCSMGHRPHIDRGGTQTWGACLLFFSTTSVCGVNKKSAIDHHCRRSQVLDGTRIFANFVDAHACGYRVSWSVRQPDFTHRPAPARTGPHRPLPRWITSRRHVVDCLGESLETHSLRSVPRAHHRRLPGVPIIFQTDPLTPANCRTH